MVEYMSCCTGQSFYNSQKVSVFQVVNDLKNFKFQHNIFRLHYLTSFNGKKRYVVLLILLIFCLSHFSSWKVFFPCVPDAIFSSFLPISQATLVGSHSSTCPLYFFVLPDVMMTPSFLPLFSLCLISSSLMALGTFCSPIILFYF